MATQTRQYLPDLPQILAGESQILSWFELSECLLTQSCPDSILLSDEGWISHLTSASLTLGQPRNTSNAAFEGRTAAISISPTSNEHYDINEIKSDALWMSNELNLDLLEALRITLLEWQNRPQSYLQAGYSDAEIASLNSVYGSNLAFDAEIQATFFLPRSEEAFKTQTARRCRQIFTYFRECMSLTRTILLLSEDSKEFSRITGGRKTQISLETSIDVCADLLTSKIKSLVEGPKWSIIDEDTNYVWQVGHLQEIAILMECLITICRVVDYVPSSIVRKWVTALATAGFFAELEPSPLLPIDQVNRIHVLADLTSLVVIDPASCIADIDTPSGPIDASWLRDTDLVAEVHDILYNALAQSCTRAAPAAFIWALCLQKVRDKVMDSKDGRDNPIAQRSLEYDTAIGRQGSLTMPTQSCFEDAVEAIRLTGVNDDDTIGTILSATLHAAGVTDILADLAGISGLNLLPRTSSVRMQILQEAIAAMLSVLPDAYGLEILVPQFAILAPLPDDIQQSDPNSSTPCTTFLNNSLLLSSIFDVAASRFPHEATPFLRLCRLLARAQAFDGATQYITFRLKEMEFFTHSKAGPLGDYHTVREDENLNLVELENNCYASPTNANYLQLTGQENSKKTLIIPAGTIGDIISDVDTPIVRWHYHYSGFAVIGEWLELYYNGVLHDSLPPRESIADVVTESILLIAQLLRTTNQAPDVDPSARDAALNFIFEEIAMSLAPGNSITDIVFNILEQELQSYRRRPTSSLDTSILHASITFVAALLDVRPTEFWPRLAKTSIVKFSGNASPLYALVNGTESASGTAQVTEAVANLYQSIVNKAMKRLSNPTQHLPNDLRPSVKLLNSDNKIFEDMLCNVTSTMIEIYDSLPTWKQLPPRQESRIVSCFNESFLSLLYLSYGVGSTDSVVTGCYHRAAEVVLNRLNSASVNDAKAGALIQYILPATRTGEIFMIDQSMRVRLTSCVRLAMVLLKAGEIQALKPNGLKLCLFDLSPIWIRQIDICINQRCSVAQLFCTLLQSVPDNKSASLLASLGSTTCVALLNYLVTASLSFQFHMASVAWDVLAEFVSRDQQWLSVIVLTGTMPNREFQTSKSNSVIYRGKLFVNSAIICITQRELWDDAASDEKRKSASSILKFLNTAQQNWPWALPSNSTTTNMFKTLIDMTTRPNGSTATALDVRNQVNAFIVDLGSVVLQHSKSVRDLTLMKMFFPLVKWLTQNALDVASYNTSLHTNLGKNFLNKFGYDISDFRRTRLIVHENNEYYDTWLADTILDSRTGWRMQRRRADQSFFAEMNRANANMNAVASDLILLQSFRNLCIEHAAFFVQDLSIRTTMAHIIQRCLAANTRNFPSEQIFETLLQSRIDIALALMKCLVEVKAHGSDFRNLLVPAWQCVMHRNSSYETAIANDDLSYWHSSLCLTLLAMQFHVGPGWKPLASAPTSPGELLKHAGYVVPEVVEIGAVVVGDGLVTIINNLLEQKQIDMQQKPAPTAASVGAKDITLVLNILETILRMFRLPDFTVQLSERLLSSGAVGSCVQLFTLSHLLTSQPANEPVYAALAARLLVSFSTLPLVAEEMAIDGVLSQILTARITQAMQKIPEGVSHLDQRSLGPTLYTLWSEGILSLALNLLHAVRAPIAAEISIFLNSFHQQLSILSNAFQAKPEQFITMALAKEVATVSLISYILEGYRLAGASVGIDPTMISILNGFDEHKKSLRENLKEVIRLDKGVLKSKIVPLNDKELIWHRGDELRNKIIIELKSAISCLDKDEPIEIEGEQLHS